MGGLILLSLGVGLFLLGLVAIAAYVTRPTGHGKHGRYVRKVALPLFVPLILTLTVCAIANAGGGFRGRRGPPPPQFRSGVHVDFGVRGFNAARGFGGTWTFLDRRGRLITVDAFGNVIDIR